jgi:uncharacterized membrane protein
LRAQPFLADASVVAYADGPNAVRVEVETVERVTRILARLARSGGDLAHHRISPAPLAGPIERRLPVRDLMRRLMTRLADAFWLVPALLAVAGAIAAELAVWADRSGLLPQDWIDGGWVYNGSGTGASTLLGVIAGSSIGVAGTVFSITIAALSLTAGQMGPRLLRNFTHDRGVQVVLGTLLGTFVYALMVLRSVRTEAASDPFAPQLSLTLGILLGFASIASLVYFVAHMAGRINVDTVVDLVGDDLRHAMDKLTGKEDGIPTPDESHWRGAQEVTIKRHGYLQQLATNDLATWAARHGDQIRLLVRPGDHVFPGVPCAVVLGARAGEGVADAVASAMSLGATRVSAEDLEYAVRKLVEVAVRALSPSINDPHTAITVLDRLGTSLCEVSSRFLPTGVHQRDDRTVLVVPAIDYPGLVDAMFHLIRQSAERSPAVLIRLLEVLTAVATCERRPERLEVLRRHAAMVIADAERTLGSVADLADVRERHATFERTAAGSA